MKQNISNEGKKIVGKLKRIEIAKLLLNENIDVFKCPLCKEDMITIDKNSMGCINNHCFDISKKGYVNLLNSNTKTIYDKELFESRHEIYNSKAYDNLTEEIKSAIHNYTLDKNINYILDAGCGEGYFLNKLYEDKNINNICKLIGIDIAKEGISIATRGENEIIWCISDLSNLPFKDNKFDVILNILSPANYKEFTRVLNDDGIIVKIVPELNYLKEIRTNIQGNIKNNDYDNKNIVAVFKKHLSVVYENRINYKTDVSVLNLMNLVKMTPLTSTLDEEEILKLIKSGISNITIDLRVMVGTLKK
ncbi:MULTISPECIES: putative RNA methyltransferase [unclassified Clostridioides]|uniref:putative RNA methyltransferase n=1 Tax=unclassified Clostridioides TaxID=2635829 RepID=UPI001D12E2C0|nr:methyltransferase domain-containing protein [Clostridioides sp. ZZV14-6045]MCC0731930.1 methyltransferase domain-containing protein [Clostridioides sp. ZZV14-6048]MCC0735634.1 methyltransferase domain-containing protein [Clostridioides sp. ZZV14-6009]MCC0740589.1 methyltransferase domain-containing protein [Clostridioides sp. ZZV14-5902]